MKRDASVYPCTLGARRCAIGEAQNDIIVSVLRFYYKKEEFKTPFLESNKNHNDNKRIMHIYDYCINCFDQT